MFTGYVMSRYNILCFICYEWGVGQIKKMPVVEEVWIFYGTTQ